MPKHRRHSNKRNVNPLTSTLASTIVSTPRARSTLFSTQRTTHRLSRYGNLRNESEEIISIKTRRSGALRKGLHVLGRRSSQPWNETIASVDGGVFDVGHVPSGDSRNRRGGGICHRPRIEWGTFQLIPPPPPTRDQMNAYRFPLPTLSIGGTNTTPLTRGDLSINKMISTSPKEDEFWISLPLPKFRGEILQPPAPPICRTSREHYYK